jgi:hypothetical protein
MSAFVGASAPGCHVSAEQRAPWILGAHPLAKWRRRLGVGKASLPELSLEPKSKVLSLINDTEEQKVYFVSICHPCDGGQGDALAMGQTHDASGQAAECVTLVVRVAPREVVDACVVRVGRARDVVLDSDIVTLEPELSACAASSPAVTLAFPLPAGRRFLCSQSACGGLTHRWHRSTYHAVGAPPRFELGTIA